MSFLDIFRSAPTATSTTPDPAAPTAPATPVGEVTPATPVATPVATPAAPAAPLDAFSKLWETDPNAPTPTDNSVFGTIDPQKVFDAAKQANFAGSISQETLAAISAGGEGAVKALQQAMNATTQAAFAQSTLAATKMIEQAVAKMQAAQEAALPGLVARHAASDSLRSKNPALSSPAAAPVIKALEAQIAIKHPNATASQLTAMAEDYLGNFAQVVAPAKPTEPIKPATGEVDWSTFLK